MMCVGLYGMGVDSIVRSGHVVGKENCKVSHIRTLEP